MYQLGQGLFGKIRFKDGVYPKYDRPYLIIDIKDDSIGVLNISSAVGKAAKLLLTTNKFINKHDPPFKKKSFAKLDSLTYISINEVDNMQVLANGKSLDTAELNSIIKQVDEFKDR